MQTFLLVITTPPPLTPTPPSFADMNLPWSVHGKVEYGKFYDEVKSSLPVDVLLVHIPLYRPDNENCGPHRYQRSKIFLFLFLFLSFFFWCHFLLTSSLSSSPSSGFLEAIRSGQGPQYLNILSREGTEQILKDFGPKLVFSGDDHDHCAYTHPGPYPAKEFTVGTFSWLQGNPKPSFALLSAHKRNDGSLDYGYAVCFLPNQISVLAWYGISFVATLVYLFYTCCRARRTKKWSPPARATLNDDPEQKDKDLMPRREASESLCRGFLVLVFQMLGFYCLLQLWYYFL